jgi:hypothetical protein
VLRPAAAAAAAAVLAVQPAAAVLNNYKANLKKIMGWNNAGKTLKHVVGVVACSQGLRQQQQRVA